MGARSEPRQHSQGGGWRSFLFHALFAHSHGQRGGSSWLQIIPDLQIPGPRSTVDIESLVCGSFPAVVTDLTQLRQQPPLEKSGRDAQPSLMRPTEETRLLDERIAVDEPSSAAKKEATPRTEGFQYESFGGGPMRGGAQ